VNGAADIDCHELLPGASCPCGCRLPGLEWRAAFLASRWWTAHL